MKIRVPAFGMNVLGSREPMLAESLTMRGEQATYAKN